MYERVKDSDSANVSSMDARTSPLRHRRVEPSVSLNSKVGSLPHPVSKGDKVAPRPNISSPAVTKAAAAQARAAELSRAIQDQVVSFTPSSPRQFNLSSTYESRKTGTDSDRISKVLQRLTEMTTQARERQEQRQNNLRRAHGTVSSSLGGVFGDRSERLLPKQSMAAYESGHDGPVVNEFAERFDS